MITKYKSIPAKQIEIGDQIVINDDTIMVYNITQDENNITFENPTMQFPRTSYTTKKNSKVKIISETILEDNEKL